MSLVRVREILSKFNESLKQDPVEVVGAPEFESVDPSSLRCRWPRYSRPKSSGVELAFVELKQMFPMYTGVP